MESACFEKVILHEQTEITVTNAFLRKNDILYAFCRKFKKNDGKKHLGVQFLKMMQVDDFM